MLRATAFKQLYLAYECWNNEKKRVIKVANFTGF